MATPFSQTMRSLNTEQAYTSLVGLAIAVVLLLVWLGWFLFAPITLYATSNNVETSLLDEIIVRFPASANGRIEPGQEAIFYVRDEAGRPGFSLSALVTDVRAKAEGPVVARVYVRLDTADEASLIALSDAAAVVVGYVSVATDIISPATLVAQQVRLLVDSDTAR